MSSGRGSPMNGLHNSEHTQGGAKNTSLFSHFLSVIFSNLNQVKCRFMKPRISDYALGLFDTPFFCWIGARSGSRGNGNKEKSRAINSCFTRSRKGERRERRERTKSSRCVRTNVRRCTYTHYGQGRQNKQVEMGESLSLSSYK